MKTTLKRRTANGRAKKQTTKRNKRLAVRRLNEHPAKDMTGYGKPAKVNTKSKKTDQKSASHLSEKQKLNKKTLPARKKANKASKKKVNEIKSRMKRKHKK
jgi:hypothetical protein